MTTAQVAEVVGRTPKTVNQWANEGRLPIAAQANGRVFRRADVLELVADLEAEAQAEVDTLRAQLEAAEQRARRLHAAARPWEGTS